MITVSQAALIRQSSWMRGQTNTGDHDSWINLLDESSVLQKTPKLVCLLLYFELYYYLITITTKQKTDSR